MLVSAYVNGSTAGSPPPPQSHERAKRGIVKGWSTAAVRRHTKWLYSIDSDQLDGLGLAVTLTVRETPASAAEWTATRRSFIMRLERAGIIRVHWLTEWQRRGAPHLHCAIYFPAGTDYLTAFKLILTAWLDVAGVYGALATAQDIKRIDGVKGWLQYLSKHASRGVRHYQRMGSPSGWEKTGRLWGHGGTWPEVEPLQFVLARSTGHRYRRLVRAWTIADARKSADPKRIKWARRMLTCHDVKLSPVRGVSGWVPEVVSLSLIALLIDQGEGVIQRVQVQDENAPANGAASAGPAPLLSLQH